MGITRLEFMLFYSVFLIFIIFITGMGAIDVLNIDSVGYFPIPTGAPWELITLPLTYFWTFLNISSEFAMVFAIVIMPFLIGMVVLIAEMIRGN